MDKLKVIVIGGGAAGFFSAISAKTHHPDASVHLLESSMKLLSKVRISGGGRCNVTHHCFENSTLIKHYPRGSKFLKKAFRQFSVKDTIDWFQSRGVELKTEEDGRMFPITDDSITIVNALKDEAQRLGVEVLLQMNVEAIDNVSDGFSVRCRNGNTLEADKVIIASGGSPSRKGLEWLEAMGQRIVDPVPSLFTFNIPSERLTKMMGLSVNEASVKIEGEKLKSTGPLLITHWGLSGPAVLKLSAFGARLIAEKNYRFAIRVNWSSFEKEDELRESFHEARNASPKKKISNLNFLNLPGRLWEYMLERAEVQPDEVVAEMNKKSINRLIETLYNDRYEVEGKTTFKEEFVTCGGVDLKGVDPETMESKQLPGIYYAGELLDIDGVTGGFNFQAAWTTGLIAGQLK